MFQEGRTMFHSHRHPKPLLPPLQTELAMMSWHHDPQAPKGGAPGLCQSCRERQRNFSRAMPVPGALSQWSLLAADKMARERHWKSYFMCKVPSFADTSRCFVLPSSAAACSPKWGYDMYHLMHTFKCPVFLRQTNWKTSPMAAYEKGSHAYSAWPLSQT